MSVEVTLKDEDFIETAIKIESAVDRALADGAAEIQGTAQQIVPVDTGLLRSSITIEKTGDLEWTITAGSPEVDYARYVEQGTRFQAAQPYMRPAYERHRKSIEAQVKLAAERASR